MNHNGKEYEKGYVTYIYMTESVCYTPETNKTL